MKFCPTCETRYDEEILRFCTKDGAPLVDENQPDFMKTPDEPFAVEAADYGEETIIRFEKPAEPKPAPDPEIDRSEAPRIVIPMSEEQKEQKVRARTIPPYQPLPQKSNTAKVVLLTIIGTLGLLAFGVVLFYFLQSGDEASNSNVNTNPPNVNLSTNLNIGNSNYNYNVSTTFNTNLNTNLNLNLNTNINANIKTPTPTPKPSPSPSPTPSVTPANTISSPTPTANTAPPPTPKPTVAATPNASPKTSPSAKPEGSPGN